MAILPVQVFTRDNVRVRLRENYQSQPLAEKSIGQPKGVYFGFLPSAVGDVVTLSPDPTRNASALKVPSRADPGGMSVIVEDSIVLDFTGVLLSELPIYLIATANYSRTLDTTAQIEARTVVNIVNEFLGSPAEDTQIDLSQFTLVNSPILPGSLVINVTTIGFGPGTITDDGRGNLVGVNTLSTEGTIDYQLGTMTGTTTTLLTSTLIEASYTEGVALTECLLCVVDGVPGDLTVSVAAPLDRDEPVARDTVPFGYMPAGSIEDLAVAVLAVNEVVAARLDLDGTVQASLSDRLNQDLSSSSMAGRLGTVVRILRSNDHDVDAGVDEISVGGSLSEVNRDHEPKITLGGGGSETQVGAITDPERNVCVIIDATTGSRLVADTREIIFGRLEGPEIQVIAGTSLTFIKASTGVIGADTSFISVVDPGDLLKGDDGLFYEVKEVTSNTQIVLKDAYLGDTITTVGTERHRFLLKFKTASGSEESDHTLDAATTIRFFFPSFVDQSQSVFDTALFMHAPGERPQLPDATTTVAGKVQLAEAGGLTGSIDIQEDGVPIGTFSVVDFTAAGGGINETLPGEVDVDEIGPQGGDGATGPTGVDGQTGGQGESYTALNINEFGNEQEWNNPPGGLTLTHSVDMGHEIAAIYGWWTRLRSRGGTNWGGDDEVEITNISAAGQVGTIDVFGTSTTRVIVTLYLSSAGTT